MARPKNRPKIFIFISFSKVYGQAPLIGLKWELSAETATRETLPPEKNAQGAALQANAAPDIGAAGADADIGAHRWLDRFAIRTASGQGYPCQHQQSRSQNSHYTNAFHRLT